MALLGKLAVAVVGDVQQLKKSFAETKKEVASLDKEIKRHGLGLQQVAKYATLAGAAIVGAMGTMALSVAKSAEQIDLLAKRTGESRETLQGLAYAAQQEGTSIEALGTGLARLARNMDDAAKGTGEAKDTFKALGISVRDSSGHLRKTSDVLMNIADRFKGMDNEAEMTAAAMDLLGRSGADLVPFLRMGREEIERLMEEAERLGYVLDEEAVIQLEALGDEMEAVKTGFQGLGRQIAGDTVPALLSLAMGAKEVMTWLHAIPAPIRQIMTQGTLFAGAVALIGGGLAMLVTKIAAVKAALAALGTSFGPFIIGTAIIGGIIAIASAFARLREEAELAKRSIDSINDANTADKAIAATETYLRKRREELQYWRELYQASLGNDPQAWGRAERENPEIAKLKKEIAGLEDRLVGLRKKLKAIRGESDSGVRGDIDTEVNAQEILRNLTLERLRLNKESLENDLEILRIEHEAEEKELKEKLKGRTELNAALAQLDENYAIAQENLRKKYKEKAEKEAQEQLDALLAAQDEINEALMTSHDLALHQIEEKADEFRKAGVDEVLIAKWIAAQKEDLARREADAEYNAIMGRIGNYKSLTDVKRQEWIKQLQDELAMLDASDAANAAHIAGLKRALADLRGMTARTWETALTDTAESMGDWSGHMADLATTTAEGMRDIFSDTFFAAFRGDLKEFLDDSGDYFTAFLDSINRAVSNALADMFASFLIQQLFPGLFLSMKPTVPAMAAGGSAIAGRAYLVGERGPELFVPQTNGTVVPNDRVAVGAPQVIVQNINQTGMPVRGMASAPKFDGKRWIIRNVLQAVADNTEGARDVLGRR